MNLILAFLLSRFPTQPKKSRQKFKNLKIWKNEKSFQDQIKGIEANKTNFFVRWAYNFRKLAILLNGFVNDQKEDFLFLYSYQPFVTNTTQKMKFPIKDFFSKCYKIHSFLPIWSNLLKKSLMENFIFCVVKTIL